MCTKKRATRWNQENPDRRRVHMRRSDLRCLYGLSLPEYEAMVAAQSGKCAACGKLERRKRRDGTTENLSVDHDHVTGKVRGLLCKDCNVALGCVQDQPSVLRGLLRYLGEAVACTSK